MDIADKTEQIVNRNTNLIKELTGANNALMGTFGVPITQSMLNDAVQIEKILINLLNDVT